MNEAESESESEKRRASYGEEEARARREAERRRERRLSRKVKKKREKEWKAGRHPSVLCACFALALARLGLLGWIRMIKRRSAFPFYQVLARGFEWGTGAPTYYCSHTSVREGWFDP